MTVAALILCATTDSAIADTDGRVAVRRMVESAWAGGAVPIVVVAPERDGAVAAALAGSPAVLAEPAPAEGGPVAQIRRAMAVALERVTETDAGLVWPGAMVWVDPETVTSLIEAYGVREGTDPPPELQRARRLAGAAAPGGERTVGRGYARPDAR